MNLDALDHLLLGHFEDWFPRPSTLDFCEYDASADDVQRLCEANDLYEDAGLIWLVASHARLGLVGDWTCYPAFTGHLTVFTRRRSLISEFDLAFLFLHSSPAGRFSSSETALLKDWSCDLLLPWRAPLVERRDLFDVAAHALDLLALHSLWGGDVEAVLELNLQQVDGAPTPLVSALLDFVGKRGVQEDRVRAHFSSLFTSFDNQSLPKVDLCLSRPIDDVLTALALFS
ncbi:MAG: hypothetical protein JKY65_04975 [Planctomycetes bacterium]|nr:hypothetical protein [Planctomycetota bacterium]